MVSMQRPTTESRQPIVVKLIAVGEEKELGNDSCDELKVATVPFRKVRGNETVHTHTA